MKAIFIPSNVYNPDELKKLNDELKDCDKIEYSEKITIKEFGKVGTLLIVRNYTRKDKLKKLNEISNEGTNNNTL